VDPYPNEAYCNQTKWFYKIDNEDSYKRYHDLEAIEFTMDPNVPTPASAIRVYCPWDVALNTLNVSDKF